MQRYEILRAQYNQSDKVGSTDAYFAERWAVSSLLPSSSYLNNSQYCDLIKHHETGTILQVFTNGYVVVRADGTRQYSSFDFSRSDILSDTTSSAFNFKITASAPWSKGRFLLAGTAIPSSGVINNNWTAANAEEVLECRLFLLVVDPHFDRSITTGGTRSPHQVLWLKHNAVTATTKSGPTVITTISAVPVSSIGYHDGWSCANITIRGSVRAIQNTLRGVSATAVEGLGYQFEEATYTAIVRIPDTLYPYGGTSYGVAVGGDSEWKSKVLTTWNMLDISSLARVYEEGHTLLLRAGSTFTALNAPQKRTPVFFMKEDGDHPEGAPASANYAVARYGFNAFTFNLAIWSSATGTSQRVYFHSPCYPGRINVINENVDSYVLGIDSTNNKLSAYWNPPAGGKAHTYTTTLPLQADSTYPLKPQRAILYAADFSMNYSAQIASDPLAYTQRIGFRLTTNMGKHLHCAPLTVPRGIDPYAAADSAVWESPTASPLGNISEFYDSTMPTKQAFTLYGRESWGYRCDLSGSAAKQSRSFLQTNPMVLAWAENHIQGTDTELVIQDLSGGAVANPSVPLKFSSYRSVCITLSGTTLQLVSTWVHALQHDSSGGLSSEFVCVGSKNTPTQAETSVFAVSSVGLDIGAPNPSGHTNTGTDYGWAARTTGARRWLNNAAIMVVDQSNVVGAPYPYAVMISGSDIIMSNGGFIYGNWSDLGTLQDYCVSVSGGIEDFRCTKAVPDPKPGFEMAWILSFATYEGLSVVMRVTESDFVNERSRTVNTNSSSLPYTSVHVEFWKEPFTGQTGSSSVTMGTIRNSNYYTNFAHFAKTAAHEKYFLHPDSSLSFKHALYFTEAFNNTGGNNGGNVVAHTIPGAVSYSFNSTPVDLSNPGTSSLRQTFPIS